MLGKAIFEPDALLDVLSGLFYASLRIPSLTISYLKSSGNGHTSISNHSTYFLNLIYYISIPSFEYTKSWSWINKTKWLISFPTKTLYFTSISYKSYIDNSILFCRLICTHNFTKIIIWSNFINCTLKFFSFFRNIMSCFQKITCIQFIKYFKSTNTNIEFTIY